MSNHNLNEYLKQLHKCVGYWTTKGILKDNKIHSNKTSSISWHNYTGGYGYGATYLDEFNNCTTGNIYSVRFFDDALLQISLAFTNDQLTKARYAYLGNPKKGFQTHYRIDFSSSQGNFMTHDFSHLQVPALPDMRLEITQTPSTELVIESMVRWFYQKEWKTIFPETQKILSTSNEDKEKVFARLRLAELGKYYDEYALQTDKQGLNPLRRIAIQVVRCG